MKKIVFLMTLLFAFVIVEGQTQTQKVGDPKAYLTAEQLAKFEADLKIAELEKKIDTYGKWVGVGGEIGIAIREGLMGVVDVADKFGSTDVGKFTIVMVAWKVIGKDIIRIVLGFVFLIVMTILFVKVYKNTYVPKRVMVENPGFMKYPKKYETIVPERWVGYEFVKILMLFLYAGAVGLTYAIMFG